MRVDEIMRGGAVTCSPTDTVAHAALLFQRYNIGALPVVAEDGRLRGVVTDRDIVTRCVAAEEDPATALVRDVMTRSVVTVAPGDDAREAVRLMMRDQVRRLPVRDGARLVGVVSLADIARNENLSMEAAAALAEISSNIKRF